MEKVEQKEQSIMDIFMGSQSSTSSDEEAEPKDEKKELDTAKALTRSAEKDENHEEEFKTSEKDPKEVPKGGRTIPYNHKQEFVPDEEIDTWLQKGKHLSTVQTKLDAAQAALTKAATLAGYKTAEEYVASLDKKAEEDAIKAIEDAYGDTDLMDKAIKSHPVVRKAAEAAETLKREAAKASLRDQPYFNELESEFDELLKANESDDPNKQIDPMLAWKYLLGEFVTSGRLQEIIKKTTDDAKNTAKAELQDESRRGKPKAGGSSVVQSKLPAAEAQKINNAFGLSKK